MFQSYEYSVTEIRMIISEYLLICTWPTLGYQAAVGRNSSSVNELKLK